MNYNNKTLEKLRLLFEKRYNRQLNDDDLKQIGNNLCDVIEEILKHQFKFDIIREGFNN